MIYNQRGFKKLKYKFEQLDLEQLTITKKDNKKCIIFLHGIGGSKISLTGLASAFLKKDSSYDLLLPDLPGSGSAVKLSFDDQTFRRWFILYLGLISKQYDKVFVLGHSLGAYQCIINADLLNKSCNKLIMVCPVLGLDTITKTAYHLFNLISKVNRDAATRIVASGAMIRLSNNIMVKGDYKAKSKILISRLKELDIVNKKSWFEQCQHIQKIISSSGFKHQLSKVKISTLVIGARKDVVANINNYEDLVNFTNFKLVLSDSCGHQLPNEDPEWLAGQVKSFVD